MLSIAIEKHKLFLSKKSYLERKINNHDRIRHTVDCIGNIIASHQQDNDLKLSFPLDSPELILQVDGGYISNKSSETERFEALTSVVYRPENVSMNIKTGEGRIINKSYAASALDDAQQSIKSLTLRAAQAQGLSKNTHVTALCDGAKNCWTVVDFIQPEAGSMIKILDWFHISMKFKNLAVSTDPALKIKKIKWHLWRGFPERALYRLKEVSEMTKSSKEKIKLQKLITYLENNKDYIVDYRMRRKEGLVFTSQLAESTVESLINQRCKSKQHMSWTRKGLHALLQLKSSLASNDWGGRWQRYIMLALISSKEKQRNM